MGYSASIVKHYNGHKSPHDVMYTVNPDVLCMMWENDTILETAIIQYMPSLNMVHCPFSENDLRDTNLQFADIDQLFCSFASCWRIVLEEACNNGIRRESKENYKEILALPIYNELDANLKRATNDLIRRLYNN